MGMAIKGTCPDCGYPYKKKDENLGKRVKCKACDFKFILEREEEESEEEDWEEVEEKPKTAEKRSSARKSSKKAKAPAHPLDMVRDALPENLRAPVLVGLGVFAPYLILGLANGLGTGLLMLFFSGVKGEGAMMLLLMVTMSMVFMFSISAPMGIIMAAILGKRADSPIQAGVVCGVAATIGMVVMFIVFGIISLIAAAIFLDLGNGSGGGGGDSGFSLGTFIKIVLVTLLPVFFSSAVTGLIFWRPKEGAAT
jgi:hypothetical protein